MVRPSGAIRWCHQPVSDDCHSNPQHPLKMPSLEGCPDCIALYPVNHLPHHCSNACSCAQSASTYLWRTEEVWIRHIVCSCIIAELLLLARIHEHCDVMLQAWRFRWFDNFTLCREHTGVWDHNLEHLTLLPSAQQMKTPRNGPSQSQHPNALTTHLTRLLCAGNVH